VIPVVDRGNFSGIQGYPLHFSFLGSLPECPRTNGEYPRKYFVSLYLDFHFPRVLFCAGSEISKYVGVPLSVCVCVCVCEREREREGGEEVRVL
jgi:hypothetical protein